jgi:hypothetical protein
MRHKLCSTAMVLIIVLGAALWASADNVTIPHNFIDGTAARASEVNENFEAVKTAVDDLDAQLQLDVPRQFSVAYAAVAFTPYETQPLIAKDGYTSFVGFTSGKFFHAVSLPSGAVITGMKALIPKRVDRADIKIWLRKKVLNAPVESVADWSSPDSTGTGNVNIDIPISGGSETIAYDADTVYFIEVQLYGSGFWSITLLYDMLPI